MTVQRPVSQPLGVAASHAVTVTRYVPGRFGLVGVSTSVPSTPTVTAAPLVVAWIDGTDTLWPSMSEKIVAIGSCTDAAPTAVHVVWSARTGGRFTSTKMVPTSQMLASNGLHTR